MAHKGDSLPKKIVRFQFWGQVCQLLGSAFYTRKHLVLASVEAGDVSVLSGLGVPLSNIIAVDTDPEALRATQARFPGVVIRHARAETVAREFRRSLGSAFIDYCDPINEGRIDSVWSVAMTGVMNGGIIGCAFQYSREKSSLTKRGLQEFKDEWAELENHQEAPGALKNYASSVDWEDAKLLKAHYLHESLIQRSTQFPVAFGPAFGKAYLSSTVGWDALNKKSARGVPMLLQGFFVHRSLSKTKKWDEVARAMRARIAASPHPEEAEALCLRTIRPNYINSKSAKPLLALILTAVKDSKTLSKALNISEGTAKALRAHHTRNNQSQG